VTGHLVAAVTLAVVDDRGPGADGAPPDDPNRDPVNLEIRQSGRIFLPSRPHISAI